MAKRPSRDGRGGFTIRREASRRIAEQTVAKILGKSPIKKPVRPKKEKTSCISKKGGKKIPSEKSAFSKAAQRSINVIDLSGIDFCL